MALVDSNSNFLMVDVGANGRVSDGGVFSNSRFFKKLENEDLNLPSPKACYSWPRTTTVRDRV